MMTPDGEARPGVNVSCEPSQEIEIGPAFYGERERASTCDELRGERTETFRRATQVSGRV
jgi:hypothetical protein